MDIKFVVLSNLLGGKIRLWNVELEKRDHIYIYTYNDLFCSKQMNCHRKLFDHPIKSKLSADSNYSNEYCR